MKKKELIIANEASDRIIHRLNGRIYGLERSNKDLVGVLIREMEYDYSRFCTRPDKKEAIQYFKEKYEDEIAVIEKATGQKIEDLLNGEKNDNN